MSIQATCRLAAKRSFDRIKCGRLDIVHIKIVPTVNGGVQRSTYM